MIGDILGTKGSHVSIGDEAGQNVDGQHDIAIGTKAGGNVSSNYNIAIGVEAGTNIGTAGNPSIGKMYPLDIMLIRILPWCPASRRQQSAVIRKPLMTRWRLVFMRRQQEMDP